MCKQSGGHSSINTKPKQSFKPQGGIERSPIYTAFILHEGQAYGGFPVSSRLSTSKIFDRGRVEALATPVQIIERVCADGDSFKNGPHAFTVKKYSVRLHSAV